MSPAAPLRILLIGTDPALRQSLEVAGYAVAHCDEDADLYALSERHPCDVVLLRADSPSRDVLEHLAQMNRRNPQPMVLLHRDPALPISTMAVRAGISAYVVDTASAAALRSIIEVSVAHFEHAQNLRRELRKAQQSLGERKALDRAKQALMRAEGIDEHAAYERIRRFAMDHRLNLAQAARRLSRAPGETANEESADDPDAA